MHFCDVDGTRIVAFFITKKNVLKLIHPGVGKKQRRVVRRQQRRRMHDLVPVLLKILEEFSSDLVSGHKKTLAQSIYAPNFDKKPDTFTASGKGLKLERACLVLFVSLEFQSDRIHAVTQTGRLWAVVKDVSEMCVTAGA